MYFYYAQVDDNGICFTVQQVSHELHHPNLIPIVDWDERYVGRQYLNGKWI